MFTKSPTTPCDKVSVRKSSSADPRRMQRKFRHLAGSVSLASALAILGQTTANASVITWKNIGTDWATGANWVNGVAPVSDLTTDIALFTGALSIQPIVGTTQINGLQFSISSGSALSLTGGTLGIGSGGISILAGNAKNLTIATQVQLGANQTWSNNSTSSNLTVSGSITNVGNVTPVTLTLSGSSAGVTALNGTISDGGAVGTLALVVDSSSAIGVVKLAGANTFSGGITLKQGNLYGGANSAFGSGTITLGDSSGSSSNNAVLTNGKTITNVINVVGSGLGGAKNIISASDGNWVYYNGAITLSSADVILGNGGLSVSTTNGANNVVFAGGISGTGNITLASNDNNNTTGNIIVQTGTVNNVGTITNSGTGTTGNRLATISSTIGSNVTGVTQKSAVSNLVLSGSNSFSGGVAIVSGSLYADHQFALSTGVVQLGDSTGVNSASLIGRVSTIANQINVVGSGTNSIFAGGTQNITTFSGLVTLNNNNVTLGIGTQLGSDGIAASTVNNGYFSGGVTGVGNVTLAANAIGAHGNNTIYVTGILNNTGTITNAGTGASTSGQITSNLVTISTGIGSNVTGVTQNSANTILVLSGTNSFSGDLTIKSGTVNVKSHYALSNGTVQLGDSDGVNDGNPNATLLVDSWYVSTLSNSINVVGNGSGTNLIVAVASSGTAPVMSLSGAITLNNTNVTLANSVVGGGVSTEMHYNGGVTGSGNINLAASGTAGTNIIVIGGALNNSGTITNSGATNTTGTAATRDLVRVDSVIGANVTGVIQNSRSTLLLKGANLYSGATTVQSGTLQAGIAGQAFGVNSAVTMANVADAVLDLNDFAETIGSLTGGGSTGGNVTLGAGRLTVGGDNTSPAAYAAVISGGGGLTKVGSGTQTLSGNNTYTGSTIVSAGKLVVNGSLSSSSAVTVNSGGTLGGIGTVGSVTVNGTLAPGNSIGTINTGNLTLGSGSVLDVELGRNGASATSDQTNVAGTVDLVSGPELKLTLYTGLTDPQVGDVFFLVVNNDTDAINGVFTSLNGVTTTLTENSQFSWNNQQWQITYEANSEASTPSFTGGNDIAIMVVPEPATWAMVAGGVGMLLMGQRMRRRNSK